MSGSLRWITSHTRQSLLHADPILDSQTWPMPYAIQDVFLGGPAKITIEKRLLALPPSSPIMMMPHRLWHGIGMDDVLTYHLSYIQPTLVYMCQDAVLLMK